ncbi:MAG: hypothetical protein IT393_03905 [Nitrospirae bacterium]|nr:hypothetical protein [Nitrospirota bacterium]
MQIFVYDIVAINRDSDYLSIIAGGNILNPVYSFSISKNEEVAASISEGKDLQVFDIRVHLKTKSGDLTPTKRGVEIPVSMLPEIRRMVNLLEEACAVRGLSDEFENLEDLKGEREVTFAHPSEEELAKLLKFYHIRWDYEPKTFPIKWDESGNVVESFTPDFYLPDLNLYIELTTMKQGLVTKKNKKVKLLRTLYPEINIKLFYGKDYKRLLRKYEHEDKKIP